MKKYRLAALKQVMVIFQLLTSSALIAYTSVGHQCIGMANTVFAQIPCKYWATVFAWFFPHNFWANWSITFLLSHYIYQCLKLHILEFRGWLGIIFLRFCHMKMLFTNCCICSFSWFAVGHMTCHNVTLVQTDESIGCCDIALMEAINLWFN